MINIGDKKYERIFSLKTPTKQLIVVANKDDDESFDDNLDNWKHRHN